jgi:17beta-estradiol 17-dehydrogenase / very-long-chain 3-oxoacyl-CoA reductase
VAAEIEKPNDFFNSKAQTLAIDFAAPQEEDYEKLGQLVKELDIAVLINNVGLSHQFPEPFAITDLQVVKDIIAINCLATLRVTQLVLPGMIQRKRGLVLTLGSFGGLVPSPLLATYSASKAFLQHWSTAVASELDGSGVDLRFVVPYHITGSMSKIRKASFFIPDVGPYVKSVLKNIGRRGGSTHFAYSSTPYPSHALMQWVLENTLGAGSQTIITQIRGMHQSIRARALKKLARDGKKN